MAVVDYSFLTPTEEAYLNNTKAFTKAQQRYIGCRLRKKLITMRQEIERCNVQLMLYDNFECNEIVDRRRFELLSPSSTGIGVNIISEKHVEDRAERGSPSLDSLH
ncbi:MAG: hypothetical protein M3247_01190, partial [Thermoproteota archaeon]|nr:hypothetical protein [Thermoproteota archaeon]